MNRERRLPPDEEQLIPDPHGEIARGEDLALEWERVHPTTLAGILHFIDELRSLFGDPPVDREPWQGTDFRL